ncbi:S-4TM family putative pore-forming effector [Streptomyces sp. NBC_01635]|uniref:S-4TM family putative pore-forming effector n=1 Tax=Streptomyces sp. NBC_01635 TaxID=2975904 RepID=UPI00386E6D17|nr:S-4TM family putative pore-forming effector [Streptomyces sp. NBC_01635]WTD79541.1 S-4TM family putative pore-forming effector [Streptomyces sp. NBC_01635]
MTAAAEPSPTPSPIPRRQDEEDLVELRAAARIAHNQADAIRLNRTIGTIGLAVLAPVFTLILPGASVPLAVVAALWLIVARIYLKGREKTQRAKATAYQELYDTQLFDLPWDTVLVGDRQAVQQEIDDAAPRPRVDRDYKWYENVPAVPWPVDALACQAQNLLWGRKNHQGYARFLTGLLVALIALALLEGYLMDLSLADFALQLFAPLVPALLDLAELPQAHRAAQKNKNELEHTIQTLIRNHVTGRPAGREDCRSVQDKIFELRNNDPTVPTWFHTIRRTTTSRHNAEAMEDLKTTVNALPRPRSPQDQDS